MAETFGQTEKTGDYSMFNADYIHGGKHTSGSAGSLASITVDLKYFEALANVKCAIYDSSFNLLTNGTTEEKQVESGWDDWMTFNFGASKPSVAASTDYWLLSWHDEDVYIRRFANTTRSLYKAGQAYNGWPSPLPSPAIRDYIRCIYATYEEAPPAKKTLVQAALISIPPLIALPTLGQILKVTGGC